jgi:hypothetical protein
MIDRQALISAVDARTFLVEHNSNFHRVATRPGPIIPQGDGSNEDATVQQVQWYLEHGRWEDELVASCGVKLCTTHLRVEGNNEDDLLKLVERSSVSLADLYRKGKARGLVLTRTSGY